MPLILGAVTAAPKIIGGISQLVQRSKLRLQDTRPAAFLEKEQLARQAAAAPGMPGLGSMQNRLGLVQSGAVQNARLGAASGSDFLAAAGGADARRMQGEQQLGVQSAQYGQQAQGRLGQVLDQDSAYKTKDLDTYNKTKAALTQAAAQNFDNAAEGAASYAAFGMNQKAAAGLGAGAGASGAMGYSPATGATIPTADLYPQTGGGYQPGQVMGLNRPRYRTSRYGI